MIDYVKLEINSESFADRINNNKLLNYESEVSENTGEIKRRTAQYAGFKFLVYPNHKVIMEGSLHKYRNGGEHNFDDFTFVNLCETIEILSKTFQFSPQEAEIRGFEFGVNIVTRMNPTEFLKMIVCYGNSPINWMNISGGKGINCKQTNDVVKIYNKSLQYKQTENILRIENKVIRMRKVQNLQISILQDLTNISNLELLGSLLLDMFDNLIIHEPINIECLSKSEAKLYNDSGNPRFWANLNRSQRYKKLSKYNLLIKEKGVFKVKETVRDLISSKWNELQNLGDKYTCITETAKGDKYTRSIECINPQNIESEKRYCVTCGRDISIQKKGSRFCSEKLFGKEVKKCRNTVSNPKHNLTHRIERSILNYELKTLPLFPSSQVYKVNYRNGTHARTRE
jgi:hypothetical protein